MLYSPEIRLLSYLWAGALERFAMANKPGKVTSILQEMICLIEGGEWGHAGFVPTRRDLANRFETTTSTINDVFTFLHAMGYVMPKGRNVMINPNRMTIPALVPS